jgi:hypothetical protein
MDQKLAGEIEASRREIEKLQDRVRQLVSRRGKRAELVKSAGILTQPEPPITEPAPAPKPKRSRQSAAQRAADTLAPEKELTFDEAMIVLKNTAMAEVRLIAFNHGNVVLLFADDRTVTVKMDERGPKAIFDLLTLNDTKKKIVPNNSSTIAKARRAEL